jgi:pimeloyl-ACP methyl ester carboxylesterase
VRVPSSASIPLIVLLLGLMTGCSPGRFLAGRISRAPNSYPEWAAPEPRIYLAYPRRATEDLPRSTFSPPVHPLFPKDPTRISYRVVPPADYRMTVQQSAHPGKNSHAVQFRFNRAIPALPLEGFKQPRGTVVLLHGYGLDQISMLPWAFWCAQHGWQAVLVDLRGHGKSTGRHISFGPVESAELQALLTHLRETGRAPSPVVALGVSYGASLALRWADTDPSLDSVVAIAPYARLSDAIERIRADFVPWVPRAAVAAAIAQLPAVIGVQASDLDTLSHEGRSRFPALLIAGGLDVIAPVKEVESLQNRCAPGSKLWVLDSANHESLPFLFNEISVPVEHWLKDRASLLPVPGSAPISDTGLRPGSHRSGRSGAR